MNEKNNQEESKPPSSVIEKLKKFFRNPFFIKTQSVTEVTDFLKDAVDRNDYTSTSISRYYTKNIINYIVIIITLSIIVTYSLFTISSEIITTLDNIYVPFTLVFVLLGVGRYLHLIYNKPISYDPVEIFFNDLFIIGLIFSNVNIPSTFLD